MRGRQNNDEQTFVKFDKALATGGVAGGVATGENENLKPSLIVHDIPRVALFRLRVCVSLWLAV